jgi:hypothetical protein
VSSKDLGRIKLSIKFLYWGGKDLGRIKLRIRFFYVDEKEVDLYSEIIA